MKTLSNQQLLSTPTIDRSRDIEASTPKIAARPNTMCSYLSLIAAGEQHKEKNDLKEKFGVTISFFIQSLSQNSVNATVKYLTIMLKIR